MNVTAALVDVESSIAADRLDDAVAILADIARALLAQPPDPVALAHATWLGGVVALRTGDQAAFERLSRDAVHGLRLAGDDERAATALASRQELMGQLADVGQVQTDGAAGLMAVLERHYATLRDIAAAGGWDDPRWSTVNRRRALLPALLALVHATTGEPAPLARILDELELDAVESVLLATLASITRAGEPLLPNRLARLCFGDWRANDEALIRLRDDGRLAVGKALATTERGELLLHPRLMERLFR